MGGFILKMFNCPKDNISLTSVEFRQSQGREETGQDNFEWHIKTKQACNSENKICKDISLSYILQTLQIKPVMLTYTQTNETRLKNRAQYI